MGQIPFLGPKLKVKRAKTHIQELEGRVRAFLSENPYRFVVECNLESSEETLTFIADQPVPCDLPAIVGDAVHNLRAALDLLACEIVVISGGNPVDTHFPFGKSPQALDTSITKNMDRVPKDITDLIRAMQPYPGGQNALRDLHDLDLRDKHNTLILVGSMIGLPVISIGGMRMSGVRLRYFEERQIIGIYAAGTKVEVEYDREEPFTVTFGKGEVLEGEPIIVALSQIADFIQGSIETLEAHCFGQQTL